MQYELYTVLLVMHVGLSVTASQVQTSCTLFNNIAYVNTHSLCSATWRAARSN